MAKRATTGANASNIEALLSLFPLDVVVVASSPAVVVVASPPAVVVGSTVVPLESVVAAESVVESPAKFSDLKLESAVKQSHSWNSLATCALAASPLKPCETSQSIRDLHVKHSDPSQATMAQQVAGEMEGELVGE